MKNLICFFCLFGFLTAYSQVYHHFPNDSATWTYVETGFTFPPETGIWHFGLSGDTSINGFIYTKLYINDGALGQINPEGAFNRATANYWGGLREDIDKKVWFYKWENPGEYLLFDFDLMMGDTFCFPYQPSGITCYPVVLIDSVMVGGDYRRRTVFEHEGQTESWIEGIGGTTDPWVTSFWSFLGNIEFRLNCFHGKSNLVYGACDYPTSINKQDDPFESLEIYPIPVNQELYVKLGNDMHLKADIFTMTGRKVSSSVTIKSGESIDIESLSPGFYFISFVDEQGNWGVKKFIKNGN